MPLPEEPETDLLQATKDSQGLWASYYQKKDTGTSQTPQTSNSTYWKQQSSKTRTRERYKKLARLTTKSKRSKGSLIKEQKG